jgi:hypothetical protein
MLFKKRSPSIPYTSRICRNIAQLENLTQSVDRRQGKALIFLLNVHPTPRKDHEVGQLQEALSKLVLQKHLSQNRNHRVLHRYKVQVMVCQLHPLPLNPSSPKEMDPE